MVGDAFSDYGTNVPSVQVYRWKSLTRLSISTRHSCFGLWQTEEVGTALHNCKNTRGFDLPFLEGFRKLGETLTRFDPRFDHR